jgi:hypothetical protein
MYHKYAEDFRMMREMGVKHYRCDQLGRECDCHFIS